MWGIFVYINSTPPLRVHQLANQCLHSSLLGARCTAGSEVDFVAALWNFISSVPKARVDTTSLWIISSTSYAMEEVHIIARPCSVLITANEMWEARLNLRFYLILFFCSSFYLSWSFSSIQFFSFTLVLETSNLYTKILKNNSLLVTFLFR